MTSSEILTSRDIERWVYYEVNRPSTMGWIDRVSTAPMMAANGQIKLAAPGAPRPLRKFRAPRTTEDMSTIPVTINCDDYETGVRVALKEMRRDFTGLVRGNIASAIGTPVANRWQSFITAAIEAGSTAKAPSDGVTFFSASHTRYKSGTQGNLKTSAAATGTIPTTTEMQSALWGLIQNHFKLKDDQGQPLNSGASFTCMVPVDFLQPATEAVKGAVIELSGSLKANTLQLIEGVEIQLAVNPYLATTDSFYLVANDGMSVVRAEEFAPVPSKKAEGSDFEYDNQAHEYGVMCSMGAGLYRWESIQKHVFT